MKKLVLGSLLVAATSPAFAGASNFVIVNGTDGQMADLSITRAGTDDWKPLGNVAAPNARAPISFSNPDCAFDIRGKVGGSAVTWTGVNLCGAKSVTLKRDDQAGAWIDYDQ